jgi:hypothetical protein
VLGELEKKRNSPQEPHVEATAHLIWCFLRCFSTESEAFSKFLGPSSPKSSFDGLPGASWVTLKKVFAPMHNLGGALERMTPEMLNKPEHASSLHFLRKASQTYSVEEVAKTSMECAILWQWAVSTLALSKAPDDDGA